ncbi:probable phytol kinase 1, chloroplastic [Olea europaea var. sylvestris]|uniref:probable phytol kinase 1, chloroplastic n=1 Tax=Olea europaea var. sylvestris TaxID=158386 RepID=UPI000C1D3DEB|nr:probable phytol kinase 1, chloroplastic [Olea europaea var. sylvestris]
MVAIGGGAASRVLGWWSVVIGFGLGWDRKDELLCVLDISNSHSERETLNISLRDLPYLFFPLLVVQSLSRKLVHILSGLLFLAAWPIFSTSTGARYFASLVPLINCLRLLIHGLSLATDEVLVKSVTREGKPEELLRGPLYYVLVLILCAIVFWRDSPIGVISLAMMCGGDGIADIVGRRFGSQKLPYNQQKSWAGSVSMFLFGFLVSVGMLYYFSILGYFKLDWVQTIETVALVSFVATVVESLPTGGLMDDNISVPLASMVIAFFSFGHIGIS